MFTMEIIAVGIKWDNLLIDLAILKIEPLLCARNYSKCWHSGK